MGLVFLNMEVHIFTHADLDGIASAAIYIKVLKGMIENANFKVHFTEPHKLANSLKESINLDSPPQAIAIMDLGLNRDTAEKVVVVLKELKRSRVSIEWYDHHVWDPSWIDALRSIGVELYLDRSTCAAGVVANSLFKRKPIADDEVKACVLELVSLTCSVDLWLWEHPISPFIYRIVGAYRGSRGDAFRRMLIEELSSCRLWRDDYNDVLQRAVDAELRGFERELKKSRTLMLDRSVKAVFVVKDPGPPHTSLLASYLMSKLSADVAIIVRPDGSVSFRSRGTNVREIAVCMGGGGHNSASGARVEFPLLIRLLGAILKPIRVLWLKRVVPKVVIECYKRD